MFSPLFTVWLLHLAALVTPGANVLLVTHLAASGDRRGATYAGIGVTLGAVAWSTAAVLGVSAVFVSMPALRLALQLAGASYLLYVAFRIARAPLPGATRLERLDRRRALRAGLLTNLSNPKAALFFASIFSSALPAHPGATLVAASIAVVFLNALAWHGLLAFVFSRPGVQAGYASRRALLSGVAATVVGVIGVSMLAMALAELS